MFETRCRHAASGRPLAGGRVVKLGAASAGNNAGVADADEPARDQHLTAREQRRCLEGADCGHAAGDGPLARCWTVELGAGKCPGMVMATRS